MSNQKGEEFEVNKMLQIECLTKQEQRKLRKGENRMSLKGPIKVYENKHYIFYIACNGM